MTEPTAEIARLRAEVAQLRAGVVQLECARVAGGTLPAEWFEHVSSAIIVSDANWAILAWNRAAERLYGWPSTEACGQTLADVIAAVRYSDGETDATIRQALALAGEWSGMIVQRARDGREVVVESTIRALRDAAGTLTGTVITNCDTSARVAAEAAQRTLEHQLSAILTLLPVGVAILDDGGAVSYTNPALEQIMGLSSEQLHTGAHRERTYLRPDGSVMPPEEHASARALAEQRAIQNVEMGVRTEAGREVWMMVSSIPVPAPGWSVVTVYVDTTAHKLAAEALHANEQHWHTVIENGEDGIILFGADHRVRYVSQTAPTILGYSAEVFHTLSPQLLTHPHDWPALEQFKERICATPGAHDTILSRARHQDGSWRWIKRTLSNQLHNPAIGSLIVSFRDVTARVEAETALQASEERWRAIVENGADGIVLYDSDGRMAYISPTVESILGYPPEVFRTLTPQMLTHTEEWAALGALRAEVLASPGSTQSATVRTLHQDGSWRWIARSMSNQLHNPAISSLIVSFRDVTARIVAEQALRASEAHYRALAENFPNGAVMLFDRDLRYTLVDGQGFAKTGMNKRRLQGATIWEVLSPETTAQIEPLYRAALAGLPQQAELTAQGITHMVYTLPIADAQGTVTGGMVMTQDISIRKQAEQELKDTNMRLQEQLDARLRAEAALVAEHRRVVQLKNEFMATVSHELRTPLAALLGHAELLMYGVYGEMPAAHLQPMQTIQRNGRHLLAVINDILDYTKFEDGQAALDIRAVAVEPLCQECLRLIAPTALAKQLLLTTTLDPSVVWVQVDEARLRQILSNLLTNAVKFTPAGGAVELQVQGDYERQAVTFTVVDTGIGISEPNIRRLFQPFGQVDSRLNRMYEGTGMGLALVRRLTEAHGGSVAVESTPSLGSRFSVTLPWRPASTPNLGRAAAPELPQQRLHTQQDRVLHILIAEDNEANIVVLQDALTNYGYRVAVAHDGVAALEQLHATPPAAMLLDLQLPQMSGVEVLKRIRADTLLHGLPVIVLTAVVMPGDRERYLAAGADVYLPRPVSVATLLTVVADQVARRED